MWPKKHSRPPLATLDATPPRKAPDAAALATGKSENDPAETPREQPAPRSVKMRFVAVLCIVLFGGIVGLRLLHDHQMRRMADHFLVSANKARQSGDLELQAAQLRRYLNLVPDDTSAEISLALALSELAATPRQHLRVLVRFEAILRDDPDAREVRRKLIDLQIAFGRYRDAIVHLKHLLHEDPGNAELHELLAGCHEAQGNYELAVIAYKAATRAERRRFSSYESLARVLSDHLERYDEAQDVLDDMVRQHREDGRAYLARARFHLANGRRRAALIDLRKAEVYAPEDADVLILIAELIRGSRGEDRSADAFDSREIRRRLQSCYEKEPESVAIAQALAHMDLQVSRTDLAERRIRSALLEDPENLELLWTLTDVLIATGEYDRAREELERMREQGTPRAAVSYMEARLFMAQREWLRALRTFELIPASIALNSRARTSIQLHRAECYRQLGHEALALRTHREVVKANALSEEGRLGMAESLARAGQIEEALAMYRRFTGRPAVELEIARLMIRKNQTLPESRRDWDSVERALNVAGREPSLRFPVLMLRASMAATRGETEKAVSILRRGLKKDPDALVLWVGLVDVHDQLEDHDQAENVLQEARERFGDTIDLAIAEVRHLVRRGDPASATRILELADRSGDVDEATRLRLERACAEGLHSLGRSSEAIPLWRRVSTRFPDNVAVLRELADAAIACRDLDTLRDTIRKLKQIEGQAGPYWKLYEANRLILRAEADDYKSHERAIELLDDIDEQLASSAMVPLIRGAIAEMEGDSTAATGFYRQALSRGERSPQLVHRTIRLLYRSRQFLQAQSLIEEMQQATALRLDGELGRLTTAVAIQAGNREAALQQLTESLKENPSDPRQRLWAGQVFWAAGRNESAEREYRRALNLDRNRPETWVALVYFLYHTGKRDEARRVTEEAEKALSGTQNNSAIAQCYEIVGDTERAEKEYLSGLGGGSEDYDNRWALAQFYLRRGRLQDAEPHLRTIIESSDRGGRSFVHKARRNLATVLMVERGYPGFLEGMRLIEQNLSERSDTPEDLRMKAKLLASRPRRRPRREAIRILDTLGERFALTPADRFQLIRLHVALGEWETAHQQLHALIAGNRRSPDFLAYGVRAMLDHDEDLEAPRQWLETLEKLRPEEIRTIELRMRMHVAEGQPDECLALARSQIAASNDDAAARRTAVKQVASILTSIYQELDRHGRVVDAERFANEATSLLKQLADAAPSERWRLVRFLAVQVKHGEAMRECERAWTEAPSDRLATVSTDLLRRGRPGENDFKRVRSWLEKGVRRFPESAEMTFQLANVCHLQGDYDAAKQLYKQTLKLSPGAVVVHNELALLEALDGGDREAALQLVNRAINELAGPLPFLLDTRATIYLALGRNERALRDLEEAVADAAAPEQYFHMAQAHASAGDLPAARSTYQKGLAAGLHARSVHPLERDAFKKLDAQMREL